MGKSHINILIDLMLMIKLNENLTKMNWYKHTHAHNHLHKSKHANAVISNFDSQRCVREIKYTKINIVVYDMRYINTHIHTPTAHIHINIFSIPLTYFKMKHVNQINTSWNSDFQLRERGWKEIIKSHSHILIAFSL